MSWSSRSLIWGMAGMTLMAWTTSSLGVQNDNPVNRPRSNEHPSRINRENFEKIEQGKGKLSEVEVKSILGQPTRQGKPFDGITSLIWEEKSHITATLRDGKTIEFSSEFLPHLKSTWLTEDRFKKLKNGMSEAELQNILGKENFIRQSAGNDTCTISWSKENSFEVQFKDGTVAGLLWVRTSEDENATDPSAADERTRLEGAWTCVKIEIDGEDVKPALSGSMKQVFEKDTLKFYRDDEYSGEVTFQIDPTKTPKAMDWTYSRPERLKGKTRRGIYRLEGDTLTICFNISADREERPSKFETAPGSGHFLHVYQRKNR